VGEILNQGQVPDKFSTLPTMMLLIAQNSCISKLRCLSRGVFGRALVLSLMLLHLWVPIAAAYQGVAANVFGESEEYTVICTANGIQVVRLGEDQPSSAQPIEHCLSCLAAPFNTALVFEELDTAEIAPFPQEPFKPFYLDRAFPTSKKLETHAPRAPPTYS